MHPTIIFIGAGPIGLLGAIQLKLTCPDVKILMFEKYKEPVRNHAMYVDKGIFTGMNMDKHFDDNVAAINKKVIISDLEKSWRAFAQQIGIEIVYQEIKSVEELEKLYPHTNFFVGSGGLRGVVHPQVFKGENQVDEPLRHAVEVKYKAQGKTQSLSYLTPSILATCKHTVSEYVGHLKDGLTPISLRIFIDPITYEAMKGATFKKPYTLANNIPAPLLNTIKTYMNARKHFASEIVKEDSIKISTITLALYASKKFCQRDERGKVHFQIGEEAFACPFYRSFNDNARGIPYFIMAMKALLNNKPINVNPFGSVKLYPSKTPHAFEPLDYYTRNIQRLIDKEIITVRTINHGLKVAQSVVTSSQKTPAFSSSSLYLHKHGKTFLAEEYANRDEKSKSSCVIL